MKRFILFCLFLLIIAGAIFAYQFYYNNHHPSDFLVIYGNVDVRQVDLGFRVSGRTQEMPFQEGDFVPAGILMARLDSQPYKDQVKEAKAHVASAQASLNNSERLLKRRQSLVGSRAISQEDYDIAVSNKEIAAANVKEAQATLGVAQTNLEDTLLYSPADGIILTRIREPGAIVKAADPIYTLSLTSPIWVRTYVSERDLGLIYPGMPAEVLTDTPGAPIYHGHIGFISPVAEFTPKNVETTKLRTDLVYRLRVITENPNHGLRQGMPVTVRLHLKPFSQPQEPSE